MPVNRRPWKIVVLSAALVVIAFAMALWLFTGEQQNHYNETLTKDLTKYGEIVRDIIAEDWPEIDSPKMALASRTLHDDVGMLIITASGKVLGTSGVAMWSEHIRDAPEVKQAFREKRGVAIRPWGPRGEQHICVAIRTGSDKEELGVVWVTRRAWTLAADNEGLARLTGIGAVFVIVMTAAMVLAFTRIRRRMLYRLVKITRRLSEGDLHTNLNVSAPDEFTPLLSALHALRNRLANQVDTIDQQRRMLEAMVDKLDEGVVVVRSNGHVQLINPSAARLLDLTVGSGGLAGMIGRPVETCIPQHALQKMLLADSSEDEPDGRVPITIESTKHKSHLLADVTEFVLAGQQVDSPEVTMRMLVLSDVTELQRTIQLRTDFVANASHELRTPLSTIRAAVETLLTMNLAEEADAAENFMQVINRHSARLEAMVADLLDLSRLEAPNRQFELESMTVRLIFDELQSRFSEAFERKNLHWHVHAEPSEARNIVVNPQLIRLVLNNLVDNAIKFTNDGGNIRLNVLAGDADVQISVSDDGCGISEEECERVFERFYQVERGRSGHARGTGLGLSIVRHAVGAMRGSVSLESKLGKGTTVTVTIPQPTKRKAVG